MKGCVSIPIAVCIVIIFVVWLRYQLSKNNRAAQKQTSAFWEKENRANFVRKKDISNLDYIKIPLEALPFQDTTNEEISHVQNQLIKLSKKKILNLSGYSNTDLKLAYGTANISILSEYDQNYNLLIRHLNQWGALLFDEGQLARAQTVLELAVKYQSDIGSTYTQLANIYAKNNNADKIKELIDLIGSQNSLSKESTLASLHAIYETASHAQE